MADFEPLRRAMVSALRSLPPAQKSGFLNTLGALLYRESKLDDAVRAIDQGLAMRGDRGLPQDWAFLAMAHARLGHGAEAKAWLGRPRSLGASFRPEQLWDNLEINILRARPPPSSPTLTSPPTRSPPERRAPSIIRSGRPAARGYVPILCECGIYEEHQAHLSYDGTDFSGWQRQPDRRTVQQVLEEAIGRLTGAMPATNASGRTDAGVHAIGQVVHFLTASLHPPGVFVKALNATLPPDIRVLSAEDVPQSFHCTFDAKSKMYRYTLDNGPIADPFSLRYSWHVHPALDAARMDRAAQALTGRHDFRSFETNWPNRTSSVRTVFSLAVRRDLHKVHVEIEADGFLYNMVRAITGTLVLVGTGRRPESFPSEALAAESRAEAGPTAPPQGPVPGLGPIRLIDCRPGTSREPIPCRSSESW